MNANRLSSRLGGSRGVSNVLGLILVIGMVVTATMVIVTVGAVTFQNSQSTVSMESAVAAMEELNDDILEVAADGDQQQTVSIPSMEDADLRVEDTGWVNISVENESTGALVDNQTTGEIGLGKIVYERDQQSVAIQGGAVWRTNEEDRSVTRLNDPTFQYRYGDGDPSVIFPIVNLTGASVNDGEVTLKQAHSPQDKLQQARLLRPEQQLNITVKSEYYLGWYSMFDSMTEGNVSYDPDNETVTAILFGPDLDTSGGISPGAVLAPYSSAYATNANEIDSYNSRVGPYNDTAQVHNNTFVAAQKGFSPNSEIKMRGELNVGEDFEPTNDVTVEGPVKVGGDVPKITRNVEFGIDGNSTFSAKGNITKITNSPIFYGDVIFGGDAGSGSDTIQAGTFHQDLDVGGELRVADYGGLSIHGNVTGGEDIQYESEDIINGSIHAGERAILNADFSGPEVSASTVELRGGSVMADINAKDDVKVLSGNNIDGDIRSEGDVIFGPGGSATVDGNVTAEGDVRFENGTTTINGDVHAGGEVLMDAAGTTNGKVTSDSTNTNAIDLDDSNAEIDGDAKVPSSPGDGINENPGTITGSQGTHSGPSVSVDTTVRDPKDPLEPDVPKPDPSPASGYISTKEGELDKPENQVNSSHSYGDIEDDSPYPRHCTPCEVPAGEYYLDEFQVTDFGSGKEEVILNTTNGDIEMFVDGEVDLSGPVEIVGDGKVEMFVNERGGTKSKPDVKFQSDDAEIGNVSTHDATQLTMYTHPDAAVGFESGSPKFVGVVYGPGDNSTEGTLLKATNDAEIYGSVMGNPEELSSETNIHYDERLGTSGGGTTLTAVGPRQVKYLQVSVMGVEAS